MVKNSIDLATVAVRAPWQYAQTDRLRRLMSSAWDVTSSEVNVAAGLDWRVYQSPAYVYSGDVQAPVDEGGYVAASVPLGAFKLVGKRRSTNGDVVPSYFLNLCDDSHEVLGVVQKRYRIVQNHAAPELFDRLVKAGGGTYEAAGVFRHGAQVWWLLLLRGIGLVNLNGGEELEMYALLMNSHDGSTSVTVGLLPLRATGQTVLAWTLPRCKRLIQVKHCGTADKHGQGPTRLIELAHAYRDALVSAADELLHTPFSAAELAGFLDALIPTPTAVVRGGRVVNRRGLTVAEQTKALIEEIYLYHPTQTHIQGTLWGAVQACQFYSDHLSIARNTEDATADENRFKRAASGRNLGSEAFTRALKSVRRPLQLRTPA